MSQQKHTPGPYGYGEDNDGWYLESLSAKEKLGHGDQIAYCLSEDDARRISACLNACEGVRTEHLENNLPIVELVGRHSEALSEIDALKAERVGLVSELNTLVDDINALKDETQSQRDKILGLASAQDSEDVFRIIEAMQLSAAHKAARVDCVGTVEDLV